MSIIWAGLAPHAPIIIPEIGMQRHPEVQKTWKSCTRLAEDFMAHDCDVLIVLSPHTQRPSRGISVYCDAMIKGSFSMFSAKNLTYEFLNGLEWIREFSRHYSPLNFLDNQALDHGALVPLHFLAEAGWNGVTIVLSVPWQESECSAVGKALKKAVRTSQRVGILASGDMSHCLKPDAPSGYHASGSQFDELFVSLLNQGESASVGKQTRSLRQTACEDVFHSCQIAWSSLGFNTSHRHFYSYEGPFGVGYTVARLYSAKSPEVL
jgi:aromatic ring-opening dioxygenase LigB subunit